MTGYDLNFYYIFHTLVHRLVGKLFNCKNICYTVARDLTLFWALHILSLDNKTNRLLKVYSRRIMVTANNYEQQQRCQLYNTFLRLHLLQWWNNLVRSRFAWNITRVIIQSPTKHRTARMHWRFQKCENRGQCVPSKFKIWGHLLKLGVI